jgi:hypothetical protein
MWNCPDLTRNRQVWALLYARAAIPSTLPAYEHRPVRVAGLAGREFSMTASDSTQAGI